MTISSVSYSNPVQLRSQSNLNNKQARKQPISVREVFDLPKGYTITPSNYVKSNKLSAEESIKIAEIMEEFLSYRELEE